MGVQAIAQYSRVMATSFPQPVTPTSPLYRTVTVAISQIEQAAAQKRGLAEARDENAFFKDCDRLRNSLIYDGKTIYEHFKEDFDALDTIEDQEATSGDLSSEAQKTIRDIARSAKESLRSRIVASLNTYLRKKLGSERDHLIPEIMWLFSQKAATALCTEFVSQASQKYGGKFASFTDSEKITLEISSNPRKRVRIRAVYNVVYKAFFSDDSILPHDLAAPMRLKAKATYRIGRAGNDTEATFDFSFKPVRS